MRKTLKWVATENNLFTLINKYKRYKLRKENKNERKRMAQDRR